MLLGFGYSIGDYVCVLPHTSAKRQSIVLVRKSATRRGSRDTYEISIASSSGLVRVLELDILQVEKTIPIRRLDQRV